MTRSTAQRFVVVSIGLAAAVYAAACASPEATVLPASDGWGPSGGGSQKGSSNSATPPPASTGSSGSGGSGGGSSSSSSGGFGSGGGSSSGAASSGGSTSSSGAASSDAGASTSSDSGHGSTIDAGVPTTPPAQGPLGSCGNPACGTDLNECGCQATDSAGNQVQLGCQAGGQCVCVVNGNVDTQPFDENGACADPASTAAQFLTNCSCQ
jgi:hypothetical protein